jgi:hypothetical protein
MALFWRRDDQRWEKTERYREAGAVVPTGTG